MSKLNLHSKFILFFFMIILNYSAIAQEEQGFLKLEGTNVVDTWDREDPNLIFWNSSSIAFGISLHSFDIINLPLEIWTNSELINDQVDDCISEWNSIGCLDLYLDDTFPSIPMGFTTDKTLFGNYTHTAGAGTVFAVTEFVDEYSFEQYSSFSETNFSQTQIYLNNTADFDYFWSTDLFFSEGYYPFKVVLLHEMGHILGLGHSLWEGDESVMALIRPYNEDNFLFHLQSNDILGYNTYCEAQGITGLEDALGIDGPMNITQNSSRTYIASFYDFPPTGDFIISDYSWELNILHSAGIYTLNSEVTPYPDKSWEVNISSLPSGYCWLRNTQQYVIGVVKVTATDNDGVTHEANYYVYLTDVPPNTTNGNLTQDEIWCGEIDITGDVIVPLGITLEILPGTILNFLNSSTLIVRGTLNSVGLPTSRIVYNFTTPSEGIKLKSNSYGDIEYVDIIGGNRGITMIEAVANIRFTTISSCNFGIHIVDENYTGNTTIQYNNLINNITGLWLSNSSPYFTENEVTGSNKGVYCSNFSSPTLGYYTHGYNHITDNTYGVHAYANSNPNLGHYDPNNPYNNYGFNTIMNNTSYNLYAKQYCTVVAHNNWWGSAPPNASLFYSGMGSSIDYYFWLSTPPAYNVQGESKELEEQSQLALKDIEIDAPRIPIIVRLLNIRNLINSSRFREAFNLSKQVVSLFPDSALTNYALDLFWQAGKEYNIDSLKNNLTTIYNASDRTLCGAAGLILSGYLGENRLAFLDEIKSRFSNSYIAELALYDKFLYYYFNVEDLESAGQILAQLETEFPESQSTLDAQMIYYNQGSNGSSSYSNLNKSNNTSEIELPKEYDLLGNYPNPFNPNTNISYALPFESEVELKIFDIMGREIKSFNINGVSAGYHSILWDGLNNNGNQVSSGIYIYVFKARSLETTDQFTKSAKMIMLK